MTALRMTSGRAAIRIRSRSQIASRARLSREVLEPTPSIPCRRPTGSITDGFYEVNPARRARLSRPVQQQFAVTSRTSPCIRITSPRRADEYFRDQASSRPDRPALNAEQVIGGGRCGATFWRMPVRLNLMPLGQGRVAAHPASPELADLRTAGRTSAVQDAGFLLLELILGQDAGLEQFAELGQLGEPIAHVRWLCRGGGCRRGGCRGDGCRGGGCRGAAAGAGGGAGAAAAWSCAAHRACCLRCIRPCTELATATVAAVFRMPIVISSSWSGRLCRVQSGDYVAG